MTDRLTDTIKYKSYHTLQNQREACGSPIQHTRGHSVEGVAMMMIERVWKDDLVLHKIKMSR